MMKMISLLSSLMLQTLFHPYWERNYQTNTKWRKFCKVMFFSKLSRSSKSTYHFCKYFWNKNWILDIAYEVRLDNWIKYPLNKYSLLLIHHSWYVRDASNKKNAVMENYHLLQSEIYKNTCYLWNFPVILKLV